MLDWIVWVFQNIASAFGNIGYALTHPGTWLSWIGGLETTEDKQALMRFIYYGGSVEFFFAVFVLFLVLTAIGIWRNSFMWGMVRGLEWLGNGVGRLFAWAGLLMVLQQIMIVFLQRIFAVAEISLIPGVGFLTHDVSWWGEELKLYNAMIVTLCATYTFIQGGHVRVDLVYSAVSFRSKRMIDMIGSLIFMMPMAIIIWMYNWYFMWRSLVLPKPAAADKIELLMRKSRILKWKLEHLGPSVNGFDGYFIFKVLMMTMAGLIFLQVIAFFYRSYLERREGEASEGKYLDRDTLGEGEEAYEGTH